MHALLGEVTQYHAGNIVELFYPLGKVLYFFKYRFHHCVQRLAAVLLQGCFQPFFLKHLIFLVHGFCHAVGIQKQRITRLQVHHIGIVFDVLNRAQEYAAFVFQLTNFPLFADHIGRIMAAVTVFKGAVARVQNPSKNGDGIVPGLGHGREAGTVGMHAVGEFAVG